MNIVKVKVKSPSASIEDLVVDCALDWTVIKLKKEISTQYPGHPSPQGQKLVYAGKLLSDDNSLLGDILRLEDDCAIYTIHIVCKCPPAPSQPTPPPPQLRKRNVEGAGQSESLANNSTQGAVPPAVAGWDGGLMAGAVPTNADELNLQQMAWLQQMYGQYLTQYMQYMQSAGGMPQAFVMPENMAGFETVAQGAAAGAGEPGVVQGAWPGVAAEPGGVAGAWPGGAPAAAPQQNAPRNPPVVMNAGGGGMMNAGEMDEEEEEGMGRNRDLLDWFYVMSRVLVLFSIVYFYSSFARFALVTGLGFLVYLYQVGFFGNARRGRNARQGDLIRQGVENVRAGERNEGVPDVAEEAREGDSAREEEGANVAEDPSNVQIEPVPDQGPNPFVVAATFLTTLFTSLIPDQPQVV